LFPCLLQGGLSSSHRVAGGPTIGYLGTRRRGAGADLFKGPLLRLLFVGLALLLVNLWIFLKWMYVSRPRKGGRRFSFRRLLTFLSREVEGIYGLVQEIWIPPPGQLSRERKEVIVNY